jgi:outer membrane lipoprotein-sorting protein
MSELHEQESEFERLVQGLPFDDAARPQHRDAVREKFLARVGERSAVEQTRPAEVTKNLWTRGRELMRRPLPRLAAVCAACLVVAGIWLMVPGRQSTAEAFNKFAETLVAAKTARFSIQVKTQDVKFDSKTFHLFRGFKPDQKFRSYFMAPAEYRTEFGPMVSIADWSTGNARMMSLMPAVKQAMIMKITHVLANERKVNYFRQLRELLSNASNAKESKYQRIGEKEIGGQRAVGFRMESPAATVTLWGDPTTGKPLEIDSVFTGTPITEVVMSDFEINVELKESLFDMTPPPGYQVRSIDLEGSPPSEKLLLEGLKATSDIGEGEFPSSLDSMGLLQLVIKRTAAGMKAAKGAKGPSNDEIQRLIQQSVKIGQGFQFVMQLPDSADAHYAGKGIKRGTKERPIFWYKPEGTTLYRVIYADLTVKQIATAPQVLGAKQLTRGRGDAATRGK